MPDNIITFPVVVNDERIEHHTATIGRDASGNVVVEFDAAVKHMVLLDDDAKALAIALLKA